MTAPDIITAIVGSYLIINLLPFIILGLVALLVVVPIVIARLARKSRRL